MAKSKLSGFILGLGAVLVSSAAVVPLAAHAQSGQPVKLLVGYAAGGPVDTAARQFAVAFSKALDMNVIVENRPGVSGALAGAAVSKSEADAQMLYFAASPTLTITPHVVRSMPFDPQKGLTPVAPILSYANVLVVNKDQPFKTIPELITYARANPGKVTFGSAGMGASNHLSGELLAQRTGTQLVHIPYKGNAPAMTDVISGQISMMFDIIGTARNYISAGRVNVLAVTSPGRNASLPNVPSMQEAGIAGYDVQGWYALYAPPGLPADRLARYQDATRKALASEELKQKLIEQGYDLWSGTAQDVSDRVRNELALWATVTKGMKFE
ncbi:Bug family tripartite tricarboxylate transporter substrate binding protein [Noviherbaspirillum sp.]|uniref:Bug family tripartite tricarboxylate transporter substrate binding protein n=1 Tax=Noviherbaspirillum sp. TaxID=1926288 RepID=UPI002FE33F55